MSQNKRITASKLYDYIQCPHRVWRDIYGPQEEKIKDPSPFVELLWERGVVHEADVVSQLGQPFVNIAEGSFEERLQQTVKEMEKGTPLIYQGVIQHENLFGIPDLLERAESGFYVPTDIKAGRGMEGSDAETGVEGKPKDHYAVQLGLYIEILKQLGFCRENKGLIIDVNRERVEYDLSQPKGKQQTTTWWVFYESVKHQVIRLVENEEQNKPAMSGTCKICLWHDSCKKWCETHDDLSRVFYVGRSARDTICRDLGIETASQLADLDIRSALLRKETDKSFLRGIGAASLEKAAIRARILTQTKKPFISEKIIFPAVSTELFFDIEDDPTQDFIYLHGVYERRSGKECFKHFLARQNAPEQEKEAWQEFWTYISTLPVNDFAVYYYSHHEKSAYNRLRKKYPDVISQNDLDAFFNNPNVIDLYSNVVLKKTDWPVSSYSLKDLATYIGFTWRDTSPSGALSIQWYNEYLKTGDDAILKRILEYNEDDCRATMVLKDAIGKLSS